MQSYDQLLTFSLPFTKVLEVIIIDEGVLMIIHHNFCYAVVRLNLPSSEILCHGSLPNLSSEIKKYDRNHIIFLNKNKLQIFNWIDSSTIFSVSLSYSQIYHNSFYYFVSDQYIAYWKQSFLNNQQNYNYQIEVYKRNGLFLVKKYRLEEKSAKILSLIKIKQLPQIVTYETGGYSIIIAFLQHKIYHQIKSIYKLLMVSSSVDSKMCLHLGFTHNELPPDNKLCYEITQDSIKKYYQPILPARNYVYNNNFSIVVPDYARNYIKPCLTITAKYNYNKKIKSILMLQQLMNKGNSVEQEQKLPEAFSRYFIEMISGQ